MTTAGAATIPDGMPASYTTVEAEDRALHDGAALIDRRSRGRLRLGGPKAREVLTGLVTNDILALEDGRGCYAAALTAKGKVIADLRVYLHDGALWIDTDAPAWPGWWATVRKYINPRLAAYEDRSRADATLTVAGPLAVQVLAAAGVAAAGEVASLPLYAHRPLGGDGGFVARVPELGVAAFDLWIPSAAAGRWSDTLRSAGAVRIGAGAVDTARIEAGRPAWGRDMDETTLAQEARLDDLLAIAFTKGCYTGQETVARIHFRGHVNRQLQGVHFHAGDLPAPGTVLLDAEGREVGDVRSVVRSPRFGLIGLAMVRREIALGTPLTLGAPHTGDVAEVAALPFSPPSE